MPFPIVKSAIKTLNLTLERQFLILMTHSRESDVLTTHSLTSHFIGETSESLLKDFPRLREFAPAVGAGKRNKKAFLRLSVDNSEFQCVRTALQPYTIKC